MAGDEENTTLSSKALELLKHDIRNQLSNIHLALEGLKYEVDGPNGELGLYFDSITQSAKKIDKLLDNPS
jgi:hypothetical protein